MSPDPGADAGIWAVSEAAGRKLVIEADGGSRGNPGPAGYGAVVLDGSTGELLAEAWEFLGLATNNVAEYRGLIAGLRAAHDIDPTAYVEAKMDSRLVVEQMSGRWQVKHPDMRVLAREAADVASSFGRGHVTYTWIPRERNTRADRLANQAMDSSGSVKSGRSGGASSLSGSAASQPSVSLVEQDTPPQAQAPAVLPLQGKASTLVLVRHGVTAFTIEKRFSGSGDPPLIEAGRAQARMTGARLAARGGIDRIVASPLSRARETAQLLAKALGLEVELDDDLQEVDFGAWEGLTYPVVAERWPRELALWHGDPSISPPDGESYEELRHRITAVQQRLVNRHRGDTICVVTHSRPIAMFAATVLDAPLASLYRLQVDNAGISEIDYYEESPAMLRTFNDISHLR
jgi:broad specificity phosphatase PhoE/ribonuclease HI